MCQLSQRVLFVSFRETAGRKGKKVESAYEPRGSSGFGSMSNWRYFYPPLDRMVTSPLQGPPLSIKDNVQPVLRMLGTTKFASLAGSNMN